MLSRSVVTNSFQPVDYTVHRILQARILEWVAFPFSGGSSQPRDWTQVSCIAVDSLPAEPQGKPKNTGVGSLSLLQGSFPTQESNWGLLPCRWILYQLSYEGSPTHVYSFLYIYIQIIFHYRLLQDIKHCSLCYTVTPCCLSILYYSDVYLLNRILLIFPSPLSLSPLVSFLFVSVYDLLIDSFVLFFISTHKWYPIILVFIWLLYLMWFIYIQWTITQPWKEGNIAICSNIDGSREHHIK